MAAPLVSPLSTKELHQFHRTDRELFCFLIFKLRRDVTQSLLVMALWLWLEHIGFPNLIHTLMGMAMSSNPSHLNAVVDEAVACLACLQTENPSIPRGGGLPLTKAIVRKHITMTSLFYLKKHTAIAGIRSILKNICSRIFSDVLHIVLKRDTDTKSSKSSWRYNKRSNSNNLVVPGFPHPLFGEFEVEVTTAAISRVSLVDRRIWKWGERPWEGVTEEDRSMFLTFSRGFPVTEMEVRLLFVTRYGNCVESVTMGEPELETQKLFAVMVLKHVAFVDRILRGQRIAKLVFNGKHVWARKFEFRSSH